MMIDINRLREIVAADNHVTAATVVLIADHLLTWWRASQHLHTEGEVVAGKVSPWVRIKRDAAAVLWDRRSRYVLDRAIKYLEENHGVTESGTSELAGGQWASAGNKGQVDLSVGGVGKTMDREPVMGQLDEQRIPRKGRKKGSGKIPESVRPRACTGTNR